MDDSGIYLKFEKQIPGNVDVEGYENWIMLSSCNLSINRGIANETGQGKRDVGVPRFSAMMCTKESDKADAGMYKAHLLGTVLGKAEIHQCQTSGDSAHKPYKIFELSDTIIADYNDNMGMDSFSLVFTAIKIQVNEFDGTQIIDGEPVTFNLATGKVE